MKNKHDYSIVIDIICFLLILVFVYTATSKLMNYSDFRQQMLNQVFHPLIANILIWTLPPIEIAVALCLLIPSTRRLGLMVSGLLMLAFTMYVGLVLVNVFDRVPCSCGGVLKFLGWESHFVFNLFFLLLSLIGIFIYNRERRFAGA